MGHQHLSVFGIGKDISEHQWRSLFRQLVARNLVDVDVEGFGGLRLNESCRPLLRGETGLQLRIDPGKPATTQRSQASQLVRAHERDTWERLRALRKRLADEHGVPPYVIFPDSTLLDMLRQQPGSMSDMAQVSGVGQVKLERYGADFLAIFNEPASAAESAPAHDLQHEIITLARHGMTPEQIARQHECSLKNVYSHLARAIGNEQLSLEQALDLPEELLGEIQDAFLEGDGELPPAAEIARQFGQLDEGVLYCVRAALQAEFG